MFAPPPIQLTRAQIEQAKQEAKAREEAKRKSTGSNGSSNSGSLTKIASQNSLQRTESRSPKRKNGFFGRGNKLKVSSPIAQPHVSKPRQQQPSIESSEDSSVTTHGDVDRPIPAVPFGEQPRRAPAPPKRPARSPSELFISDLAQAVSPPRPLDPKFPEPQIPLPPLPTHAKRKEDGVDGRDGQQTGPCFAEATLTAALARLDVDDSTSLRPAQLPRASTAPVLMMQADGNTESKNNLNTSKRATVTSASARSTDSGNLNWLNGVQSGKIGKVITNKRASVATSVKTAIVDVDGLSVALPYRAAEEGEDAGSGTSPELQQPSKRRKKGETMSMLLDAGFFPLKRPTSKGGLPVLDTQVDLPSPLKYLNKTLPATPDSITSTPVEMYQNVPRVPRPVVRVRRDRTTKRSPLAQISGNPKATSHRKRNLIEDASPSRLSAIPEFSGTTENSPPASGVTTPTATQIHLRGGSVLTVMPPEMTPWQRHIYVQGPTKLPKPVIMPRKNSVASLEPFQEVIDQVYQDALAIPRRRSDDAVVDEICDWMDEFEFDEISFEGDKIPVVDEIETGDIEEVDEMDGADIERFSTPPAEPEVTPIERIVAKEVIEMSEPDPVPKPPVPPVDSEETLRAKGIARLSRQRKESLKLPGMEGTLPFAPVAEETMLDVVSEVEVVEKEKWEKEEKEGGDDAEMSGGDAEMSGQGVDQGGFDWDDDVEELDAQSTWTAPAVLPRHALNRATSTRQSRNPVTKMRRLMATASAIL